MEFLRLLDKIYPCSMFNQSDQTLGLGAMESSNLHLLTNFASTLNPQSQASVDDILTRVLATRVVGQVLEEPDERSPHALPQRCAYHQVALFETLDWNIQIRDFTVLDAAMKATEYQV